MIWLVLLVLACLVAATAVLLTAIGLTRGIFRSQEDAIKYMQAGAARRTQVRDGVLVVLVWAVALGAISGLIALINSQL